MLQLSQNWSQCKRLPLQEYRREPVPRNKEDSCNNLSNDTQPHKGHEHQRNKHDNLRSDRGRGFLGKRSVPTSESLTISTVLVANMGKQSMTLTTPIMCKTTRENKTVEARILLDTGAGGLFMNSAYAKKHNFLLYPLKQPITPRNVDGTPNSQGKITHYTWIRHRVGSIWLLERLLVTGIGTHNIIFGLPWFQKYQPIVNWMSGKITIDKEPCQLQIKYWKTDQIQRAEIKDAPTTTINTMESKEEYDKEVKNCSSVC